MPNSTLFLATLLGLVLGVLLDGALGGLLGGISTFLMVRVQLLSRRVKALEYAAAHRTTAEDSRTDTPA
ncbi:MAG: hypothetical protein B7Y40_05460 [Gammaproteobacteria bacterium 28-57-27]|nr:MAG: hypothetical protein B7Y40_05460 [Gammaproteobacteria bacterium 28-57-27]